MMPKVIKGLLKEGRDIAEKLNELLQFSSLQKMLDRYPCLTHLFR